MPLSWLWVICMAIIRSGWVLRPRTVMVLQPLTSHMCPGCTPLVVGPTHARGGTLDLLMTDVPNLLRAAVVAPIGNSDNSSLRAVISMAQAVPNFCVGRKGFVKHQVNWNTVCGAIQDLPWRNIWSADNPVVILCEHLSLLVGYVIY